MGRCTAKYPNGRSNATVTRSRRARGGWNARGNIARDVTVAAWKPSAVNLARACCRADRAIAPVSHHGDWWKKHTALLIRNDSVTFLSAMVLVPLLS